MGRFKKHVVHNDVEDKDKDKVESNDKEDTTLDEEAVQSTDPVDAPPIEMSKVQASKHEPKLSTSVNKSKNKVEAIIRSINGKELTLCNCYEDDKCDDVKVLLTKKPDVFLNGEKTTVAALDNGDYVCLSQGSKDGVGEEFTYKRVDATREVK